MEEIEVRPFRAEDQEQARELILHGLAEHWGELDEGANPDLDDIAGSYGPPGHFVVAELRAALVATGGFLPLSDAAIQIHRMSVAAGCRRTGLGSAVLETLLGEARARGFARAVLETTDSWAEAISFYERHGFRPFDRRDGDVYFEREL